MKPLAIVLLLSGCSTFTCPQGDVELRSRAPVIDTMPDVTASRQSQQIECISG